MAHDPNSGDSVDLVDEEAAAGAAALLPDLLNSSGLMEFLASTLQDLEDAQGGEDDEARGLLAQLEATLQQHNQAANRQALREAPLQQQAALHLTDIEIASQIDSLTEQLTAVELQLASMEEGARQLVCAGANVWMGTGTPAQATGSSGEEADSTSNGCSGSIGGSSSCNGSSSSGSGGNGGRDGSVAAAAAEANASAPPLEAVAEGQEEDAAGVYGEVARFGGSPSKQQQQLTGEQQEHDQQQQEQEHQ